MSAPGSVGWPPARPVRAPRADLFAAIVLLAGGLCGLLQLAAPWLDAGATTATSQSVSGWQLYRLTRAAADASLAETLVPYAILGVAAGGLGLLLLGAAVLLPIAHRPLGCAALVLGALCLLAALWVLIQARDAVGVGISGLFQSAQLGWYLFLATGVLGLIGAAKAVASP